MNANHKLLTLRSHRGSYVKVKYICHWSIFIHLKEAVIMEMQPYPGSKSKSAWGLLGQPSIYFNNKNMKGTCI